MTLFRLLFWHLVGSLIFGERLVNWLTWELFGQEEKEGLEKNSSLPFLDNLEEMKPKNL